jgi:putative ABC transport system substrate-binding protein
MRRRDFIKGIAGSATVWPLATHAQQKAVPVIGFLSARSPVESTSNVTGFRDGLRELGYSEGQNVQITFRWAEGQYDLLPSLAAELVRDQVAVIAATGGVPSALAAKAATATIPIVFTVGDDPVKYGLVTSFNRPGGNVTGVALLGVTLDTKRLELALDLVPKPTGVGFLINPDNLQSETQVEDMQAAASAINLPLNVLKAATEDDIDTIFETLAQQRTNVLLVGADGVLISRRKRIVSLAARHQLPTIYQYRVFAEAGGLISYGPNLADQYHQAGTYVGRILNGEKPANLPVLQPTKFELVINLKTAKALGITIPSGVLAVADDVIE